MAKPKKEFKPKELDLNAKIAELNKNIGYDLVGQSEPDNPKITTGSYVFDWILDGGFEIGSIMTLYGKKSCLKTTLGLKMVANSQKDKHDIFIVNAEKGYNEKRANSIGVDLESILTFRKKLTGEEYFENVSEISSHLDMILIDSLCAMIPTYEEEKREEASGVRATTASMLGSGLRKLNNRRSSYTSVVMINQERDNPNVMGASTYMPGGRSVEFYSDYVNLLKRVAVYDIDGNDISSKVGKEGHPDIAKVEIKIQNKKNRKNIELRTASVIWDHTTHDFDRVHDIYKAAELTGVLEINGGWRKLEGIDKSFQSKELMKMIKEDSDFRLLLEEKIKDKLYA